MRQNRACPSTSAETSVGRFPTFAAALPLNDPDASVTEIHRAVDELGARGFQICSNVRGKPITAEEFLPLFDAMATYDLPIWLHPYRGAIVDRLPISSDERERIYWRNAAALLKLH